MADGCNSLLVRYLELLLRDLIGSKVSFILGDGFGKNFSCFWSSGNEVSGKDNNNLYIPGLKAKDQRNTKRVCRHVKEL